MRETSTYVQIEEDLSTLGHAWLSACVALASNVLWVSAEQSRQGDVMRYLQLQGHTPACSQLSAAWASRNGQNTVGGEGVCTPEFISMHSLTKHTASNGEGCPWCVSSGIHMTQMVTKLDLVAVPCRLPLKRFSF